MPATDRAHEPQPSTSSAAAPIPRPRPAAAVPVSVVLSAVPASPALLSVLLIDDSPADAEAFRNLLAEVGGEVRLRWARTLDEAATMIDADTACILLDLELPD